jgi:hypothetical protein
MPTIKQNIHNIAVRIKGDPLSVPPVPPDQVLINEVRDKSFAAIRGSAAEWVTYMRLFATTPEQLARLIPTDGTEANPAMNDARAYMVAGGPCTPDTFDKLEDVVSIVLDKDL